MEMNEDSASGTRIVGSSEFKAKCLQLIDEIAERGGEIIITKNGRPVSRLVPYRKKPNSLFGIHRDRIRILGDIVAPVAGPWEAEIHPDRVLNPDAVA